jgi:SsrA-binding protein
MKIYAENKRGRFNYEILEACEAGVVLSGAEVKSIRKGQISLKEAFGTARGNELWLTNAHISPYKPAGNADYDPTHTRKLLLKKSEVIKLISKVQSDGLTLIPLKIYDKNGKIKVELGLGKGKKKYDKRETIKNREQKREIERAIKGNR